MRKINVPLAGPTVGFLLLDSTLSPIVVNRAATEILSYPQRPEAVRNLHGFLVDRVRTALLTPASSNGPAVVAEYHSGKRHYVCRSFRVDAQDKGYSQLSVAVLLERSSSGTFSVQQVSEKFHLTAREQEVLQFLLQGLTSKEIAVRMGISANTVKAFLRLIMIKMGVSTRSGILGKAVTLIPESAHPTRSSENY